MVGPIWPAAIFRRSRRSVSEPTHALDQLSQTQRAELLPQGARSGRCQAALNPLGRNNLATFVRTRIYV